MSVTAVDPGPLSLIARGLQCRLQLAFPPKFFQFAIMPPKVHARDWNKLVNRPPFIGLGWNDLDPTNNGSALFKGQSHWSVFLVVANQASVGGRYLGDAQGQGLFQLIQAAVIVLNGYKMPGVGTAMVTKVSNAYAEGWEREDIAMAAIDVAVNLTLDVGSGLVGPEAMPDLLAQIATGWIFEPLPGVVLNDDFQFGETG